MSDSSAGRPRRVFLSHAGEDSAEAKALALGLQAAGVQVACDVLPGALQAGMPFQAEIEAQIAASGACLVLVGVGGLQRWARREVDVALDRQTKDPSYRVLPLLLPGSTRNDLPPFLAQNTLIFLDDRPALMAAAQFEALAAALGFAALAAAVSLDPATAPASGSVNRAAAFRAGIEREQATLRDERRRRLRDGLAVTELDERLLELRRKHRDGPALVPGDCLGNRFVLRERIGTGGFATVWKAIDEEQDGQRDREVAVKVLHGHYADEDTHCQRFRAGAEKMGRLQHQGIVRIIVPFAEDGGFRYCVMEYVPGGDLARALKARRLAPGDAVALALEVGAALSYAHRNDLIHRDVKPENVLLDAGGRPRLTDFDLVRDLKSSAGTRTQGLGSFLYAAPEVMENAKEADARADVYSLAMTAIFVLGGGQLSPAKLRVPDRAIAELRCTESLKAVFRQATAWERAERHATMDAFCAALRQAAAEPAPPIGPVPGPADDVPAQPSAEPASPLPSSAAPATARRRATLNAGALRARLRALGLVGGSNAWERRRDILVALPESERDAARAAHLAYAFAQTTTSGNDLFWARQVLAGIVAGHGAAAGGDDAARGEAADLAARIFDHIPAERRAAAWTEIERWGFRDIPPQGRRTADGLRFEMGSPESEEGRYHDEGPQHWVTFKHGFEMMAVPVTNGMYECFDPGHREGRENFGGRVPDELLDDHPVVNVTWYEAVMFAEWLGARVRLPREAEWEFACRAGTGTRYWSGDAEAELARVGWYAENSGGRTHAVAEKPPSPWGLYDMHGNVSEWCADEWAPNDEGRAGLPPIDPAAPPAIGDPRADRVWRGGCFGLGAHGAHWARSACRDRGGAFFAWRDLGFRLVRSGAPGS